PPSGIGTRSVLLPRGGGLRASGVPPQGRPDPHGDGGVLPPTASGSRLLLRHYPAHHQIHTVRNLPPPGLVRRRDVPPDAPGRGARRKRSDHQTGSGLLPEADELPDAQSRVLLARPLLPGAAAAPVRVRARV